MVLTRMLWSSWSSHNTGLVFGSIKQGPWISIPEQWPAIPSFEELLPLLQIGLMGGDWVTGRRGDTQAIPPLSPLNSVLESVRNSNLSPLCVLPPTLSIEPVGWPDWGEVVNELEYEREGTGVTTGLNRGMLIEEFLRVFDIELGDGRKGPPGGVMSVGEIRLRLMRLLLLVHRA